MRRGGAQEMRVAEFTRTARATLMPAISAAGEMGPPLFVFRGLHLPYREAAVDGRIVTQTYASFLPRHACLAVREERGGVDSENFLNWAHVFIESVEDLTANDRYILLIFDGYGAHMSLRVLELFRRNRIIAYALPAHTSGTTQPLDVVMFSEYKRELNNAIAATLKTADADQLDMFQYCALMTYAYNRNFTRSNIEASFRRASLWLLNPSQLLNVPRLRDTNARSEIMSPEQLVKLLDEKRAAVRKNILGREVSLLRSGFIDTTRGAVLTSNEALSALRQKAEADSEKRAQHMEREVQRGVRAARRDARLRRERDRMRHSELERRARLANMPIDCFKSQQRSMKERRSVARLRAFQKARMLLQPKGTSTGEASPPPYECVSHALSSRMQPEPIQCVRENLVPLGLSAFVPSACVAQSSTNKARWSALLQVAHRPNFNLK